MSGDSSWEEFMKALGTDLRADGGPLNLNKDGDLLRKGSAPVNLMYPGDLFDHGKQAFIFFNIRAKAPSITNPNAVTQPMGSICLYMPQHLQVDYTARYTDSSSMPLQKLIEAGRSLYTSIQKQIDAIGGISSLSTQSVIDIASSFAQDDMSKFVTHQFIKATLGPTYAAELRQKVGFVVNPFLANVYEHPDFRTFDFKFEFFPKNAKEAEQARRIIKLFKMAMHPSREGSGDDDLIWGFPYVFDVFLCTPWTDKMFMTKRSALTRADVDYSAGGVQSFFKDGHPTHTTLRLSFKELDLLTREDIEKNY